MAVGGKLVGRGAYAEFAGSVAAMKIVPSSLVRITATAAIAAEAITVVLVAIPLNACVAAGCALATLLTFAFMVTITRNLRNGNHAPCRCFGRSSTRLSPRHLVRNAILLVVSLTGLSLSLHQTNLELAATLVAVLAGAFIGSAIVAFDDIADLLTSY